MVANLAVFLVSISTRQRSGSNGRAGIRRLIVQRWWSGDEECCHTWPSELHLSPPPGVGGAGSATDTIKQEKI